MQVTQLGDFEVFGIVKNRMFMIALILSAVFCRLPGWSIENPGIGNPVGSATVPPSTYGSGLVNTPSPIDTSGNLLITGNVRRGRHFRGNVPYQSSTSFSSNLGSSSLSSFLRDTAGPEDLKTNSNKYGTQPYYSPTQTVTTMMPGRSEIFRPASSRMSTRAQQDTRTAAAGLSGQEFQQKEQALFSQAASTADSGLWGPVTQYNALAQSRLMLESKFPTNTSLHTRNQEQKIPSQIDTRRQGEPSVAELFKEQLQNIRDRTQNSTSLQDQQRNIDNLKPQFELQTPSQNQDGDRQQAAFAHQGNSAMEQFTPSMDSTAQKNLFFQNGANSSATGSDFQTIKGQNAVGIRETLEKGVRDTSDKTGIGQDRQQGDVLERIRRQLDDLTRALDATTQSRDDYKTSNTETAAKRAETPLVYQQHVPDSHPIVPRERNNSDGILNPYISQAAELNFEGEQPGPATNRGLNSVDSGKQAGLEFKGMPNYANSQKRSSPLQELNKLSQAEISAEANRIMGTHSSLESLFETKFNQHMRDADEHLKAGRYYRAAGCFSLASVYEPDNPLALAGRGHALFAAGEYVSSALFLSRALAVNPEYLLMKVDLAAILGGENKLAVRIADIEQWLARSGSSQLQFLLGYVYYRTGRLLKAKQVIDAAYEKTPESPAIQAMKIAVDSTITRR